MIRNIGIFVLVLLIIGSALVFISADQNDEMNESDLTTREELEVAPSDEILPAPRDEDDITDEPALEEGEPSDVKEST